MQSSHEFKHGKHCDRLDISKEDANNRNLAPTTYEPVKEVVLHKAPEWTIRPRYPTDMTTFMGDSPGPG